MKIKASYLLSLFYFFYFALVGVYIIFMPKLLLTSGFNATEVGMIYSAAPFMRFLLPFIFRYYIRLAQRVYIISLFSMALSTLVLYITINDFYAYLVANLLFGASMGVALPFVEIIALRIVSKERYGKVRLWGSVGFMAIALWLGHIISTPMDGLVYLDITAVATLTTGYFLIRYDQETIPNSDNRDENKDFSLSRYWAFWLSAFLLQMSFGGFYNFFTIYETAHNISIETTSYLWSFGVLCEIVLFYYQGPLLKRDLLGLLKFTILTAVLRWWLLYLFPSSLPMAYISQSLHAFSFALYYTAVIAYVYGLYRQKKLAQQFLLGMTFGLGGSLGAIIAGKIYDYDSELLFGFEAIVALLSLVAIFIHEKRKEVILEHR